jgi:hypothetical protein
MQREDLTDELTRFESKHPVGHWFWQGWRVWPVVRTRLALALHGDTNGLAASPERRPTRLARSLAWRRRRLGRWLGERVHAAADVPADVIFLTASDRGQRLGRRFTNTVVDPWAEAFRSAGSRVTVWSLGDPRWPVGVRHASVQRALDRDRAARAAQPVGAAPEWFEELGAWAAEALDADLRWRSLAGDLRSVVSASFVLEEYLRRARPRALVLDCWYTREALGAALAAHRLAIPVVDLQHGIQGHGHPCYAGWSPAPEGRYEVFPDRFWVWGEADAQSLVASNPGVIAPEQVQAVGNRWLSRWVEATDRRTERAIARAARPARRRRVVLVTLQEGVSYQDGLVALMRAAPEDWLWRVRLHRRSRTRPERVQAALAAASGRRVEAVSATREPLYALLRSASAHVTAFSTCALEALAFGVPTLLNHESGEHAFAEFIAEGVMWRHRSEAESVQRLSSVSDEQAAACRRASRRVFADPLDPAALMAPLARR